MSCAEIFVGIHNYIGLNNLIIILGFFVVPSLTYYFWIKYYRLQQTINAYQTFKKVFIVAIQNLERSETSLIDIIHNEFPKHEGAMYEFIIELDGERLVGFNKKWQAYKARCEEWMQEGPIALGAVFIANMEELQKMQQEPTFIKEVDRRNKKEIQNLIYELLKVAKKY